MFQSIDTSSIYIYETHTTYSTHGKMFSIKLCVMFIIIFKFFYRYHVKTK